MSAAEEDMAAAAADGGSGGGSRGAGSSEGGARRRFDDKGLAARISLIMWHTHQNDVGAVRKLLEEDPALVNARDYDSRTPLHVAALHGWHDLAECLIAYGADVNAQDRWQNTPLADAEGAKRQSIELLKEHGGLTYGKTGSHFEPKTIPPPLTNKADWEINPLELDFTKAVVFGKTMEFNILERIVAGSEEPRHLDLSLLQSITENFSEQRKVGIGGCGQVYKGILRNGIVAVKRLFNSRIIKDKMFHREVQSLITVRHENIVQFLGYCSFTEERILTFEGKPVMADIRERLLCFEYMNNGNLENHLTDELRGLDWHTRYEIIVGICKGLFYLHKVKNIIHMDLKPANILLDDLMVPKITDFGLSRLHSNSQAVTTSRLVSPGYCAPEYLFEGKSSIKSDIYSLGVMVIELVTGSKKEPDLTKVLRRWRHRWIKTSKDTPLGYQLVTKCLELAQRCIQTNPTARPDIVYIMDELNTIDSKGGQEIPSLEDMLGIEPLEIHFPFELDLQISHTIELTNDTDDYIAFTTKATLRCMRIEPDKSIVPPRSKCSVTIKMQAQVKEHELPNNHYKKTLAEPP